MNANDGQYEEFLAELRLAGLVVDPVPQRVTFARGATAARILTFSASGLTVDVEVEEKDGKLRLIGELAPAERAVIAVRHAEGATEVETDEDGRFRTGFVPAG